MKQTALPTLGLRTGTRLRVGRLCADQDIIRTCQEEYAMWKPIDFTIRDNQYNRCIVDCNNGFYSGDQSDYPARESRFNQCTSHCQSEFTSELAGDNARRQSDYLDCISGC